MTTPWTRAIVSLVAAMAALAFGACVGASSPSTLGGTAAVGAHPLAISFVNDARERVDVYLIGERREWLLGRVEPGARTTLRIPEESLHEGRGLLQLAVLTGARLTVQAARDPRARFAIAQSAAAILTQEWRFSQGQLTSMRTRGVHTPGGLR